MFAGDCATLCAMRCWHVCYRAGIVAGHIYVPPLSVHLVYVGGMTRRFPGTIRAAVVSVLETGMTMDRTSSDDLMPARWAGWDYRRSYGYSARMADVAAVAPYAAMAARVASDEAESGY